MKFYSGFSLKNDSIFFKEYVNSSEYCVSGFSHGSIKAFKYVKEELDKGNRVDVLQLFSPAFFQTKSLKFKRLQTLSYSKNPDAYLSSFLKSCFFPYSRKETRSVQTDLSGLEELLNYEWTIADLVELDRKGVRLEVYLGEKDVVIDVGGAREFFTQVATVTYIKDANHFLQTN